MSLLSTLSSTVALQIVLLINLARPRKHFNATWSVSVSVCVIHFQLYVPSNHFTSFHFPSLPLNLLTCVLFVSLLSAPPPSTSRLEQGVSLRGCLGREWRVLERRGPHELWPRGGSREEAGEPFSTFCYLVFAARHLSPLTVCLYWTLTLQAPGKYTVVADCEKAGPQELSVKSGDMVQLIREGEEGQW